MHVVDPGSCCFLRLIRIVEMVVLVTHEWQPGLPRSQQSFKRVFFVCFQCTLLWFICLIRLLYVISPQAMLMRQQDRLDGRVQNIDEQLTKLESDKTLMKVQYEHIS